MNNEEIIKSCNNNIFFCSKRITEVKSGKLRQAYKEKLKNMEITKQLSILKERNIKG